MALLYTGLLLWAITHLFPVLLPGHRERLLSRLGEGPYKGVFSLLVLGSVAAMVLGWRSSIPEIIYLPPAGLRQPGMALALLSILLMVASGAPSRLQRIVRHPQLSGLLLWCVAHLMINGDSRSVPLFGGLAIWATLTIISLNRRDGQWQRPDAPSWSREIVLLAITALVYAGLVFAHPWLAGVPIIG